MDIKDLLIKTAKYPFRPRIDHATIIAGLGRCGTTMVNQAIGRTTRNKMVFVTDINSVTDFGSKIIKTHDYPPQIELPTDTKVIFMFGNIIDTVISTTRRINGWGMEHYDHLRTTKDFEPNQQLFYEDQLELERMFDAWYRPQAFEFMTLRYETLYEDRSLQALASYLGYAPDLPPYRARKANQDAHPLTEVAKKTYHSLDQKIAAAEDVKIWAPAPK